MKKQWYVFSTAIVLSILSVAGGSGQAEAAKKPAVKAELKKGTLTISGKGAMPAKLKVKNKNKVKKVVIKKGVTTISNNAFKNYKNLKTAVIPKSVTKIGWQSFSGTSIKKLTIPSSVKTIGQEAFSNMAKLEKLTIPGKFSIKVKKGDDRSNSVCNKVETVAFNTKLNVKRTAAFTSNNFIVSKSDSKYKSIDGVIYSKDGKSIVRVPFMRKELVIDAGCEHFALQSVLDTDVDHEGDPLEGCQVKKIVIPPSVKRVESAQYPGICRNERYLSGEEKEGITLEIQSKQLDGTSLNELITWLGAKPQEVMKQLPEQIRFVNNMYISADGVLLTYIGKEKEITIPTGVKKIGSYAFYWVRCVEKLNLPEGLTEIGDYAFCNSSDSVNGKELKVSFPSTLRKIGNHAFENNSMKALVLPKTITSYGEYAFANNQMTEIILPETMKTIPAGMLSGCSLKKIVIPDSVVTIGDGAFEDCSDATEIQFGKSVKEIGKGAFRRVKFTSLTLPATISRIGSGAFANDWEDAPKTRSITIAGSSKGIENFAFRTPEDTLIYKKSSKEMRTFFDSSYGNLTKLKAKISFQWNKVEGAGGYQAVFSTDSKFKKNKKTIMMKKNLKKASVSLTVKKSQVKKGASCKTVTVYGKIRPYKVVEGKKVYGRWTVNTFQCEEY